MSALVLARGELFLPRFEPWRLLRPLKMIWPDGQFVPGQPIQFESTVAAPLSSVHPAPTFAETDTGSSTANQTTYTFSSRAIGTASGDRLVIVSVAGNAAAGSVTLDDLTAGGVSMNLHVNAVSVTGTSHAIAGIASLLVPAGTTSSIVVTFSGTVQNCAVKVYTLKDYFSATPFGTGSDTTAAAATLAPNCNTAQNGVCVGAAAAKDGTSTGTIAFTALLTGTDGGALDSNGCYRFAHAVGLTAATPNTISATVTAGTDNFAAVTASWI